MHLLVSVSFAMFVLPFLLFASVETVFAASTTMGFSPQAGTYDQPFTVDLVIDGNGDVYNAAAATVTLSRGFLIRELVLGNCRFSFTNTPSTTDPSFEGIILGGSAKKCTVYSLTLIPVKTGKATISLTKATVRRFGDAADVLSSARSASYAVTAVSNAPTQASPSPSGKNDPYTVVLTVLSTENVTPVSRVSVTLDTPAKDAPQRQTTNDSGTATFSNLKSGIYIASIQQQNGQTQNAILNVSSRNHTFSLSIRLEPPGSPIPSPTTIPKTRSTLSLVPVVIEVLSIISLLLVGTVTILIIRRRK